MQKKLYPYFMVALLYMLPFLTFAQTQAEILSEALRISISPSYPISNEEYTVTLQSFAVQKSTVTWFVNGKEVTANKNKDTLTQNAGNPGSKTVVTAAVTTNDGTRVEKRVTITPSRIDLHIDGNSIVPAFYQGRELPSSGNQIDVHAIAFTGLNTPPSNYLYLWKLNGVVQNGGAVRGNNLLSFTPSLQKEVVVSIEVQNSAGQVLAQKSQSISISQPELYFYEQNPLRGLSPHALSNLYTFIADEMTIRAEGYFMSPELQGQNILREWKINNKVVTNAQTDPQEITIQKEGNRGSSKLSFHIRNLQQLLQGVEKSITLSF